MRTRIALVPVILLLVLLSSCTERPAPEQEGSSQTPGKVLATVNGVPITEYDLRQVLRRSAHGEEGVGSSDVPLQTLVREEIVAQDARRLGLDRDPEYAKKVAEIEAELRAFERERLAVLYRRHVSNQASVEDSEVEAYFRENAERIRARVRVWQIFSKGGSGPLQKDEQDLKAGVPFEAVASRRFPKLPEGLKTPWDLGYLHWSQVPEAWREALDRLQPGQTSGIIDGENNRAWIIKLIDRSVDPAITFDTEKDRIVAVLKTQKEDGLYREMLQQARARADVVIPR